MLAIKQTLYRTGGDPRIVGALMNAVNNGKQVTAVVELRARFDEANNIQWARQLEEDGVHVVYGLVGYKIHAKICLVVRKEDDGIRRYVHLSHRQLQSHHRSPLHRHRPADLPARISARTRPTCSTCSPASASFRACKKLVVAPFELHAPHARS